MSGGQQHASTRELTRALISGEPIASDDSLEIIVTASDIRAVLLDPTTIRRADPKGLRLFGCAIVGPLDLTGARIPFAVTFGQCGFDSQIDFSAAYIENVNLAGSTIHGVDEHGRSIIARGLTTAHSFVAPDITTLGSLELTEAHINGQAILAGASLQPQRGANERQIVSIEASNAHIGSVLVMSDIRCSGDVILTNAKIGGSVLITGEIGDSSKTSFANFDATYMESQGDFRFEAAFVSGVTTMPGARISGRMIFSDVRILGTIAGTEHSLLADGLTATLGLIISSTPGVQSTERSTAEADFTTVGSVSAKAARIGGQVLIRNVTIGSSKDPSDSALALDNLRCDGDLVVESAVLNGGLKATAAEVRGQFRIGGSRLSCAPRSGISIGLDRADIIGSVAITDAVLLGTASLIGSRINGSMFLIGTCMTGAQPGRPTLAGLGLSVADELQISNGCVTDGEINLRDATLGSLITADSSLPCLTMSDATIGAFEIIGAPPKLGSVDGWAIGSISIEEFVEDEEAGAPTIHARLPTQEEMLELLSEQRRSQPLMAAADAYEAAGQPAVATRLRHRAAVQAAGWRGAVPNLLIGHGYFPFRALAGLLGVFLAAGILAQCIGPSFTTPSTPGIVDSIEAATDDDSIPVPAVGSPVAASRCTAEWPTTCFRPWKYAGSIALPVASLAQDWTPPTRWWVESAFAALHALSWLITALFLAGVAGVFRRRG